MKIGMVSDSLGHLSFEDMRDTAARLGVKGVEINAANRTSAPHMRLAGLLSSSAERRDFLAAINKRGLEPIAGANFDPSHLMWIGADPIAAIDAPGSAIYHVHAKDAFINKPVCAPTSRLENGS